MYAQQHLPLPLRETPFAETIRRAQAQQAALQAERRALEQRLQSGAIPPTEIWYKEADGTVREIRTGVERTVASAYAPPVATVAEADPHAALEQDLGFDVFGTVIAQPQTFVPVVNEGDADAEPHGSFLADMEAAIAAAVAKSSTAQRLQAPLDAEAVSPLPTDVIQDAAMAEVPSPVDYAAIVEASARAESGVDRTNPPAAALEAGANDHSAEGDGLYAVEIAASSHVVSAVSAVRVEPGVQHTRTSRPASPGTDNYRQDGAPPVVTARRVVAASQTDLPLRPHRVLTVEHAPAVSSQTQPVRSFNIESNVISSAYEPSGLEPTGAHTRVDFVMGTEVDHRVPSPAAFPPAVSVMPSVPQQRAASHAGTNNAITAATLVQPRPPRASVGLMRPRSASVSAPFPSQQSTYERPSEDFKSAHPATLAQPLHLAVASTAASRAATRRVNVNAPTQAQPSAQRQPSSSSQFRSPSTSPVPLPASFSQAVPAPASTAAPSSSTTSTRSAQLSVIHSTDVSVPPAPQPGRRPSLLASAPISRAEAAVREVAVGPDAPVSLSSREQRPQQDAKGTFSLPSGASSTSGLLVPQQPHSARHLQTGLLDNRDATFPLANEERQGLMVQSSGGSSQGFSIVLPKELLVSGFAPIGLRYTSTTDGDDRHDVSMIARDSAPVLTGTIMKQPTRDAQTLEIAINQALPAMSGSWPGSTHTSGIPRLLDNAAPLPYPAAVPSPACKPSGSISSPPSHHDMASKTSSPSSYTSVLVADTGQRPAAAESRPSMEDASKLVTHASPAQYTTTSEGHASPKAVAPVISRPTQKLPASLLARPSIARHDVAPTIIKLDPPSAVPRYHVNGVNNIADIQRQKASLLPTLRSAHLLQLPAVSVLPQSGVARGSENHSPAVAKEYKDVQDESSASSLDDASTQSRPHMAAFGKALEVLQSLQHELKQFDGRLLQAV